MIQIPSLSVVIPCYNEQDVLPDTISRMLRKLDALTDKELIKSESHLLLVDDGSSDDTWRLIEKFSTEDRRVKGIKLSRNRGHQNALLAGLMSATGDAVVSIDADLQDDIDAIGPMVENYLDGCEIVYGVRASRDKDTVFKRKTAEAYYGLLRRFGVDLVYNHADYRLLSRRAVDSLKQFSEVNLFLRGIVPLLGYKTGTVYYSRAERLAGESKYPLRKMLAFAIEGITAFSNIPLRLVTTLGFFVSLAAFALICWIIWVRLFTEEAIPGWASTIIPMVFLGGVQLLSIGMVGEYVAKIYLETKRRPPYFIEKSL